MAQETSPPSVTPPPSTHTATNQSGTRSSSSSRIRQSLNTLAHRVKEVMSPTSENDPSRRGRSPDRKDANASIGRGGAGNMVSSKSRDRAMISECHDQQEGDRILKKYAVLPRSSGRGGAGNIRSPSRDLQQVVSEERQLKQLEQEEKEIEASYIGRQKPETVHIGRGGAGNMIHQKE